MITKQFLFACLIILFSLGFVSCESEQERQARIARIEAEQESRVWDEMHRLAKEAEVQEAAAYKAKWINNKLATGQMPYRACFGSRTGCNNNCSQISVRASDYYDVVVTIKKNGSVYRHAYIRAGQTHTFEVPDGTYQPFFYFGRGWDPNLARESSKCNNLKGGFIEEPSVGPSVGKADPQSLLHGDILSYELVKQVGGNFTPKPSNFEEAF